MWRRALLAFWLVLVVRAAEGSQLPILFVHGWCSRPDTWSSVIDALQPSPRFGNGVTHLYLDRDTVEQKKPGSGPPSRELFTIEFRADAIGDGFDPVHVTNVPIQRKAYELYRVVQEVKRISGQATVIVIAHSMGGLVTRAYVEGFASITGTAQNIIPFQNDIARVITIGTPHTGTAMAGLYADIPWGNDCKNWPSVVKGQMLEDSPFLSDLNATAIPGNVDVVTVASFEPGRDKPFGDSLVISTAKIFAARRGISSRISTWSNSQISTPLS